MGIHGAGARILLEQLKDERLELRGDARLNQAWSGGSLVDVLHEKRRGVARLERKLARGDFVEDDAHRVEIDARPGLSRAHAFGRDVLRCAE